MRGWSLSEALDIQRNISAVELEIDQVEPAVLVCYGEVAVHAARDETLLRKHHCCGALAWLGRRCGERDGAEARTLEEAGLWAAGLVPGVVVAVLVSAVVIVCWELWRLGRATGPEEENKQEKKDLLGRMN